MTLVFDEGPGTGTTGVRAAEDGALVLPKRHSRSPRRLGFLGFFFDGTQMIGLTGGIKAEGYSLADFRGFLQEDHGFTAIECVYGSHYEDCGAPDNDKQWLLEVAIDYEYERGADADVYAAFNTGNIGPLHLGTLGTTTRKTVSFRPGGLTGGADGAFLARNMAVIIDAMTTGKLTIHNVYLFWYAEASVGQLASTHSNRRGRCRRSKSARSWNSTLTLPAPRRRQSLPIYPATRSRYGKHPRSRLSGGQ